MVQRTINIKDLILETVNNKEVSIDDIINYINKIDKSIRLEEIKEAIYELEKDDKIELLDPKFNGSFIDYLKSYYSLFTVWFTLIVTGITLLTIYILPSIEPFSILRIIIGFIFVLFIPGYALNNLLFPNKHDTIENVAFSIGFSLAIVPLIGLILNYTPLGIRLDPIVLLISITSIGIILIASYNKYEKMKND
jgi:hypothetical protein